MYMLLFAKQLSPHISPGIAYKIKPGKRKPTFRENSAYSKGTGRGVLSVEGGNIGNMNDGCSPVKVLRNATI